MGIEFVKKTGPKKIQISVDAVCHRLITTNEAISLMIHLGELIAWAQSKEANEDMAHEVRLSNASNERRQQPPERKP